MKKTITTLVAALAFATLGTPSAEAAGCAPLVRGATSNSAAKSTDYAYKTSTVWIYGDSLTWQTRAHLRAVVPERIAIDAYYGRNTRHAVEALLKDIRRFQSRHMPDTIVMAVGTNDLADVPAFKVQTERVRNALKNRGIRLVWVLTYVDTNVQYNAINRVIRAMPGTAKANWSQVNVDNRNASGKSTLLYDGIHVNARGCVLRNDMIRKML